MAPTATPPSARASMRFTYAPDAKPIDGYTIRRGIHRGGFGEVYYGVSDAGKEVALKLLTHDLETELRGVRQCLNLKHPNLVTIFDVKADGAGDTWVIMEYVSGASLEDVLRAFPLGLPIDEVRDWMLGILAGAEYLHGRGIVHRDLKPANIYRENGVVKIGDVGLSKQMGGSRRQHTEAVGTVYYMAPEIARGQYGPEVDIYSLGVIFFEMLTGRLPFDGETTAEILMKHLSQPADVSAIPAHLRPLLLRTLEKDPQRRTRTIRQLRDEIERAFAAEPLPESAFVPPPLPTGNSSQATAAPLFDSDGTTRDSTQRGPARAEKRRPPHEVWCEQAEAWAEKLERKFRPREGAQNPGQTGSIAAELHGWAYDVVSGARKAAYQQVDKARAIHEQREARRLARRQAWEASRRRKAEKRRARQVHWEAWRKEHAGGWGVWPWLVLGAVFFLPWARLAQTSTVGTTAVVGLLGGLALCVSYLSRRLPASPSSLAAHHTVATTPVRSGIERFAAAALLALGLTTLTTAAGWSLALIHAPQAAGLGPADHLWFILTGATGIMTLVGWALRTESTPAEPDTRRGMSGWTRLLLGAVTGTVAYGLREFLLVSGNVDGPPRPVFRWIGSYEVADGAGQLNPIAYIVFFGLLFWLQDWSKFLNPSRGLRFRWWPVVVSGGWGWLLSAMLGQPFEYAVLWGVVLSLGAQLLAPWNPRFETRQAA